MLSLERPDLLIFDCDGVLIDSQVIQCRIDAAEFTRLGYPVTADELARRFIGVATKEMQTQVEQVLGRNFPLGFEDERDRLVDAAYRSELKAIAGVREAVVEIGIPACVASNAQTSRLRQVLGLTDLLGFFEPNVFGADMVAHPKPAPDLFLFAADRMGVAPSQCLVIEDSTAGIEAAPAAGMPVVGFHGGGHCFEGYEIQLSAAGAAAVFREMRHLNALLGGL
jgi:HAD superfamily hydrolase (TIGR01509 family)